MEMSFSVIIIAIVSLLVLVIIVYLLAGQTKTIKEGVACSKKGGRCVEAGKCNSNNMFSDQRDTDGTPLCNAGNV